MLSTPVYSFAQNQPLVAPGDSALSESQRMALAREFMTRISAGFKRADQQLTQAFGDDGSSSTGLPEGEALIFQVRLSQKLILPVPVMGEIRQGRVALSLRDAFSAFEFPITLDPETGNASGWYIRRNKPFSLDMTTREVRTDQGVFPLSDAIQFENGDIFVPAGELGQWLGLKIKPETSFLELFIESTTPLPIEERLARSKRDLKDNRQAPASLPREPENRKALDFPFVDVATRSELRREGDRDGRAGETTNDHSASIRTAGDFAYGTLSTQSQIDNEEKLTNLRVNYKRESLDPEFLGPLKARRFEIGDLNPVRLPISNGSLEQGVRVTNIHPLRNYIHPSTTINGSTFPGWDVELYRDEQLVAFQSVGDDGIYMFENVDLFSSDNNFKIVMYGPQGEIQEEKLYIPVDPQRRSETGRAYDISVTRQNTQTYIKRESEDMDKGAPHLSALYEHPVGESSSVTAGIESLEREGERRTTLHGGSSTVIASTLLNLDTAIDNNGEMAAELVARRNIGKHQFRNEINWATDRFDLDKNDQSARQVFREDFTVNGPLPSLLGKNPRYLLGANYTLSSEQDTALGLRAGINATWNRLSMSQLFDYRSNDFSEGRDNDSLDSITTLTGSLAGYRLRLLTDYQLKPESALDRIALGIQRRINSDIDAGIDLERRSFAQLNEASAYLNWNAGFARISPAISYNSDNDLTATLNTRFGIARDPLQGKIKMFDRPITANGAVSSFVFLDKDGDGEFNNKDEPLPGVIVVAPQNSGRATTDEHGYAYFERLQNLRLTDIYVDPESLQDPFWISSFEGASILPREGYVAQMQFPIHIAGEIDGTVYARGPDGASRPLRGITLSLQNMNNGKKTSVISEPDGFYLFSKVPPGTYYLSVDEASKIGKDLARPLPQTITIGYDGTTIYGNKVYLQQGGIDVTMTLLSDLSAITRNPSLEGKSIILNLGAYKSRFLTGLTWFKLKTRFAGLLSDAELIEKPSESEASPTTGLHTLRVSLKTTSIPAAQNICRLLIQRGFSCGVEILPAVPQHQAMIAMERG